jgi:hypothetical protein
VGEDKRGKKKLLFQMIKSKFKFYLEVERALVALPDFKSGVSSE